MKRSIMKILTVMIVICAVGFAGVQAQTARQAQDQKVSEDLEKNVDTAIKILEILKKEIKDEREEEAKAAAPAAQTGLQEEWKEAMQLKLRRLARVWARMREALRSEDPAIAARQDKDADEAMKALNQKLEESIEAMEIIKEELDKMEKEN